MEKIFVKRIYKNNRVEITELKNNSFRGLCDRNTKLTFKSLESQEEKKENEVKKVFKEIIAENFPNW